MIVHNITSLGSTGDAIAFVPDGGEAYIAQAVRMENGIVIINAISYNLSKSITLGSSKGARGYGVAISPDGAKAFAT